MRQSLDEVRFAKSLRTVRLVAPLSNEDREREFHKREEDAFQRGRCEGEKSANDSFLRQRGELLELQNGIFRSLREMLPRLTSECEQIVVNLALEAAQKVIAGLPVSVEMVEAAVREALGTLETASEMTILLNGEDLELLRRVNSPLLLIESAGKEVRFEVSPQVTRGGCIVQTRFGTVDARRERKLELLRNSLTP
ncbi:MAG: FliH/SctL family protein [Verrucomicrobiia bacterium]